MANAGREVRARREEVSSRQRDRGLATLARNRHRVATAPELSRLGFSKDQIARRVADGRFTRRYRGVYVIGPGSLTTEGKWCAAALFAAPDGALSNRDAARLARLQEGGVAGPVHVTSPRRIAAPPGIRAHRCALPRDERTFTKGIPVTTTGRTILGCAATTSVREIELMLNEAFVLGLPIRPSLAALIDRYPRRPGLPVLREALRRFEGGRTLTKSELEELYLDFIDRHGLPRPRTNDAVQTALGSIEVDCCWPAERLAIEIDAPSTHGARPRMLRDRRWDRALTLAGWTPGRLMEEDFEDEDALEVELLALLGVARDRRSASA